MYNVQHGPKPGEVYHPKGRGNGYILTLGGKRLYFMGDTEPTPEVLALKNIDCGFRAHEHALHNDSGRRGPMHHDAPAERSPIPTTTKTKAGRNAVPAFLKGTPVEVRINTKG